MIHYLSKPARTIGYALALTLAPVPALYAQTNDEARLTLGIAAGYIGSNSLWEIPNQPVLSFSNEPVLFHLRRELRSDITISGHATYFSNAHFGVTGEFTYLGLGKSDGCTIINDHGDAVLRAVCDAIVGTRGSTSIVVIHGGGVYRPLSRAALQPYFKGTVGFAFTPSSTIALNSIYGAIVDTPLVMTIYTDPNWKSIRPSWTLGFGISTAPSSGYQIHVEARETWFSLGAVTEPTSSQGFTPASRSVVKGFPSILIGFDVVLAKQRGRRY